MTPGEALLEVQAALRDRGLPGGAGLRESDRTFIVQVNPGSPGDLRARPAIAALLASMGCETAVNGHGTVYGKLTGRLLPAPELPPVHVSSSDSCSVAELAAVTAMAAVKRCADCLQQLPVTAFIFLSRATGRRCSYCGECERRRQKRAREARMASR